MKKYFFFLAALCAVMQMSAQATDTVKVIEQPSQVIITETPSGVQMRVVGSKDDKDNNYIYSIEHPTDDAIHTSQGNDWELNFPYNLSFTKDKSHHWAIIMSGFYMGGGISHSWNMINNSFEIGLLNIAAINYSSNHGQDISLGVGIHHRSYSLKRPNMLTIGENDNVLSTTFYPDNADIKDRTSNLNLWTWQFPLLFRQKIYKSFAVRLGAIMNWNYKAHADNHYIIGNTKYNISQSGLKQDKITFDVMFGLSLGHTGIYCRYSPNEVFKKGYGPEIKNTWTMGGVIAF